MHHYCTYFDRNYLAQGLTLYRSLSVHAAPFTLWVLCFDDQTHEILANLGLENLRPVPLQDLEYGDEALQSAKTCRSRVEYIFTCTPSWPLFLLGRHPGIDLITYLDADLFFYSRPDPIYKVLADHSILIIGHRFPEHLRTHEIYGIYNVGWVSFRNDSLGKECLEWWRERCLEWCFDRAEGGRFADQKFLDDWPDRFPGVTVLEHRGACLGPWNWMNSVIRFGNDGATVDGQPLIFYHFQGFRMISRLFYDTGLSDYGRMPGPLRRWLYNGYSKAIFDTEKWVQDTLLSHSLLMARPISRNYPWWKLLAGFLQGNVHVVPR